MRSCLTTAVGSQVARGVMSARARRAPGLAGAGGRTAPGRARPGAAPLGIRVNGVAPQLLDTAKNHLYLTRTCWRTRSCQTRSTT